MRFVICRRLAVAARDQQFGFTTDVAIYVDVGMPSGAVIDEALQRLKRRGIIDGALAAELELWWVAVKPQLRTTGARSWAVAPDIVDRLHDLAVRTEHLAGLVLFVFVVHLRTL